MKYIPIVLILFLFIILTACALIGQYTLPTEKTLVADIEFSDQVATLVAGSLTQTAAPAAPTPLPVPSELPAVPSAQKIYQSSGLSIQFSYPDNWHLQEMSASQDLWRLSQTQSPAIALTSFEPANPPHKLEWTDQTTHIQIRLLPGEAVPQSLDDWVESSKQAAIANQLSIYEEERFQIVDRPAARLSLVSGSGGVTNQIMTIIDERKYEINVEGNLNLGKSVLSTLQAYSPGELKPPESDTPASGICSEAQGDTVTIALGVGPDGLPLAGRCIAVLPTQRIKLVNQSDEPLFIKFANYFIDLSANTEILLDKPVGEYLALGVHFLPMGPELWVKSEDAEDNSLGTSPGPVQNYANPEVGYTVTLPPGWNVDEIGLSSPNKEVIFSPAKSESFVTYLSISLDFRTLEQIVNAYTQNVPDAVREDTILNGQQATKFTYSYGRNEYYIPHGNQIILVATDKSLDGDVQRILMSIGFT